MGLVVGVGALLAIGAVGSLLWLGTRPKPKPLIENEVQRRQEVQEAFHDQKPPVAPDLEVDSLFIVILGFGLRFSVVSFRFSVRQIVDCTILSLN